MPYRTITEKYGTLTCGFPKDELFGTPVVATTFLPMTSEYLEADPGLFSPNLLELAHAVHLSDDTPAPQAPDDNVTL